MFDIVLEFPHVIKEPSKRRRAHETKGQVITPYGKKPKLETNEFLPLDHYSRKTEPTSLGEAKAMDCLWMLNCYICRARTPLWTGWNSATFQEDRPIQKIWYM